MKLFHVNELIPGMKLARDVYKGHTIFLSRTKLLTSRIIDHLKATGYRGKIAIDNGLCCPIRKSNRGYEIEMLESDHGLLRLEGDVFIESFVQAEAQLYCVGNVFIESDVLAFAHVVATGKITVRGSVAGATVVSGTGVTVDIAGSLYALPTVIGCLDLQRKICLESRLDLAREIQAIGSNIARISSSISHFVRRQKAGEVLSPADRAKLKKLLTLYDTLKNQKLRMNRQIDQIDTDHTRPIIRVTQSIREAVTFAIDDIFLKSIPHEGTVVIQEKQGTLCMEKAQ